MKTSFFSNLILIFSSLFSLNLAAQSDHQAIFEAYLKQVYTGFETESISAVDKYYAENAAEIGPDGSLTSGRQALRESWEKLQSMMDAKPQFAYKLTSWRFVKPDLALITWESHDKFFLFGQTMESDNTCSALLRKEKGQWLIEFDQVTPVRPFPDAQADEVALKALFDEAYAGFAAFDAARFAACFTEDVSFVGPFGNVMSSRKQVEQVHAQLFKAWANMPKSDTEVGKANIRFITPEVAVCEWGHKEAGIVNGQETTNESTMLAVCQKAAGKWLVAAFSMTPVQLIPSMAGN